MGSQLQNITIAAPGFAGLNTQDSPVGLNPAFAAVADNCVIDQFGRIGARKGYSTVSTNGAAVLGSSRGIEGIHEFVARDGTKTVFSVGNNKIFTGTTTLAEVTMPAGYSITANNWKIVTFNNNVHFYQRGHSPLVSTAGSTTLVVSADAAHAAPLGNEVLAAAGRLWVADLTGNKHTVYWSDTLLGNKFHGGASGSLDVTLVWPTGTDEIVALTEHNDFLIIFGKKSIIVYQGTADPTNTLVLADTIEGVGCIARDSVQHTGTDVLFLSDSGLRSFGRVVQEKSLPMRDISKNVRNDLKDRVASELLPIKSLYSPDEAFYLLTFPSTDVVYCFDMRTAIDETGAHRATTWSGLDPLALTLLDDGSLYIGLTTGIVKYDTYLDGTNEYQLRYFSNFMDFGSPSNLKFLKKFNITLVGAYNTSTTLSWSYDYTGAFSKHIFTTPITNAIAEYGIAEYGISEYSGGYDALVRKPTVNTGGSGSIVTVGIEAQITGAPYSIQKIDIHALLGRLI
tara:strand:- start:1318 stop:2850 length:1533 start_codon:yes stop_codon:yes gene_type:complete